MLRGIQAGCLTCRTPWLPRRTAQKVQAQAFGPVSIIPPSTVMLIPCRKASTLPRLRRRPRCSTPSLENSCCLTTRFAPARIRMLRSWPSCKVRTRPPLIWPIGNGPALSDRKASSVDCPRTSRDQGLLCLRDDSAATPHVRRRRKDGHRPPTLHRLHPVVTHPPFAAA